MQPEEGSEELATKYGNCFLQGMHAVLGVAAAKDILTAAELEDLAHSFPDIDSDLQFSVARLKRILIIMKANYPTHSALGILQRIGEASFSPVLHTFAPRLGLTERDFQLMPLHRKLQRAVENIAEMLNTLSLGPASVAQNEKQIRLTIARAAFTGEEADGFAHLLTGLLAATLYWVSGGKNYFLHASTNCTHNKNGWQVLVPLEAAGY